MIVPRGIKPGDRVRVTGIAKTVSEDGTGMTFDSEVDVQKLKHARPGIGTLMTADRIRDTWWQRGTVIQGLWQAGLNGQLVLTRAGEWLNLDSPNVRYRFDQLNTDDLSSFRLVSIP